MNSPILDNIAIVLVEPIFPMNIGSACRAMKNMGLKDLRLVHPPLDRAKDAFKMAHGATEILESARRVFDLEEALDDISYVVGTTARLGGWRTQVKSPRESAPEILRIAENNKLAILFGSEDRGLSNEAVRHCQKLLTIPTSDEHKSLNIAQAVLLISYELLMAERPQDAAALKLAPATQVEDMFQELSSALQIIDFLKPGNPDYWMMAFRRMFGRGGLTDGEVNMLRGVCRQIRWAASSKDDEVP